MKLTLYLLLCTLVIASAYTFFDDDDDEDDNALATDDKLNLFDVLEYLEEQNSPMERAMNMLEKRGSKGKGKGKKKVGPCNMPNGMSCQVCNYKIRNLNDMRRYVVCGGGTGLPV
ncbi:uncharacterized protein [Amphiura filiformis]|uniref:uncharacterized protein isoform X1 n=1 Tax=Amphiura filiformis TaxID=82378 RepID=UPI003B21069D